MEGNATSRQVGRQLVNTTVFWRVYTTRQNSVLSFPSANRPLDANSTATAPVQPPTTTSAVNEVGIFICRCCATWGKNPPLAQLGGILVNHRKHDWAGRAGIHRRWRGYAV